MNLDRNESIAFLSRHLRKLQENMQILEELNPDEIVVDEFRETPADEEQCARLADSLGFDGSVFRNLTTMTRDHSWNYDYLVRELSRRIETIPRMIAHIENGKLGRSQLHESVEFSRAGIHSPPEDGPVQNSPGKVYYSGQQFQLRGNSWKLLNVLWGRNHGVTFLELEEKIWDHRTKTSTIRSAVSRLDSKLSDYVIPWSVKTQSERVYLEQNL